MPGTLYATLFSFRHSENETAAFLSSGKPRRLLFSSCSKYFNVTVIFVRRLRKDYAVLESDCFDCQSRSVHFKTACMAQLVGALHCELQLWGKMSGFKI